MNLRLQRNCLIAITAIFIPTNLALALKIYNQQSMVVLLPTLDKELQVGTQFVSEEYLKLRAEQIIYLLFSLNKDNSGYVMQQLIKQVDSDNAREFKDQIGKLANDIKVRGYNYSFNELQRFEIDITNLSVKVTGYLGTHLGGRQIERGLREYELTFINRGGVVNLKSLSEVKHEDSK